MHWGRHEAVDSGNLRAARTCLLLDELVPEQQWHGHRLSKGLERAAGGWRQQEEKLSATSLASINGNCWRTIEAVVDWRRQADPDRLPLAWCFQEHRIKEVAGLWWATKWCRARGYHNTAVKALSTGPAWAQSSAGTAVATKASVALGEWPAWGQKEWPGRVAISHMHTLIPGGFLQGSVYGNVEDPEETRRMVEDLLVYLRGTGLAWALGGDFNVEPGFLTEAGLLDLGQCRIVAPEGITCSAGKGSKIDYFLMHEALASLAGSCKAWELTPCSPHCLVEVQLMAAEARATVQVCKRWPAFPTGDPPPGSEERQAPQASWTWDVEGEVPGLEHTWPEWITNAENHLCVLHDIPKAKWKMYKGRGEGLQLEQIGLWDLLDRGWKNWPALSWAGGVECWAWPGG